MYITVHTHIYLLIYSSDTQVFLLISKILSEINLHTYFAATLADELWKLLHQSNELYTGITAEIMNGFHYALYSKIFQLAQHVCNIKKNKLANKVILTVGLCHIYLYDLLVLNLTYYYFLYDEPTWVFRRLCHKMTVLHCGFTNLCNPLGYKTTFSVYVYRMTFYSSKTLGYGRINAQLHARVTIT